MLLYHNGSFWRLVLELRGSIFFRRSTILPGFGIALIALALQVSRNMGKDWAPQLPHHFGILSLGSIVGFAVVFRTSLAWGRYWEAITQLHFMYSKWADCYSQVHAFTQTTLLTAAKKISEESCAKSRRLRKCLSRLDQNFSLISAMAADRLSHGDTSRMEQRASFARWDQQVVMRRELRRGPDLTGVRKLPKFVPIADPVAGSSSLQRMDKVWESEFLVLREPTQDEHQALFQARDRVNRIMYWIVSDLALIGKDIDVAPPIQSRMYQELSNAMLGLSNCLKIADVPFPFPYAQLLTLLLVVYACFVPVYIAVFTDSLIASPILAFLLFQGMWGVNELAKELENPFGHDINDISLEDFHARFIDLIMDVRLDSLPLTNFAEMDDTLGENVNSTNCANSVIKEMSVQTSKAARAVRSVEEEIAEQISHQSSMMSHITGSHQLAARNLTGTSHQSGMLSVENKALHVHETQQRQESSLKQDFTGSAGLVGRSPDRDAQPSRQAKQSSSLPVPQPPLTSLNTSSVEIDHNLALINKRMEAHLAQVAHQLEQLVMIGAGLAGSDVQRVSSQRI